MEFDTTTLLTLAILFVASLARSTFGFADALIAMPLLTIVVGIDVARPLVALLIGTVAAVIVVRDWKNIHFDSTWRLVVTGIIGIPVGFYFLSQLDERIVNIALAVLIISFTSYTLLGPNQLELKTDKTAFLFGFLAGMFGGAYNTHGPPLVVYGTLRKWNPENFRATLQSYFVPASLIVIVGHGIAGRFNATVLTYYVASLPLLVLSIFLGRRLNQRFDSSRFRVYVHSVLILIGISLLVHAIRH